MKTSARSANLRAVLADDNDLRGTIQEMLSVMEDVASEDERGFRLASLLDPTLPDCSLSSRMHSFRLEDQEFCLLSDLIASIDPRERQPLRRDAHSVQEISKRGVTYCTSTSRKARDSAIVFGFPNDSSGDFGLPAVGIIQKIFKYSYYTAHGMEVEGHYLLVHEHLPMDASGGRIDPYREFGFAAGFLCEAISRRSQVIALSQLISHFALTQFQSDDEYFHALPVDRVSYPSMIFSHLLNNTLQLMTSFKFHEGLADAP